MFLYCITNTVNGKRYIGVTTMTLRLRWQFHRSSVACGSKTALHCAMRKYGEQAFAMEEVERLPLGASVASLFARERELISAEGTKSPGGYNLTDGGEGTVGYRYTDEQKDAARGRRHSPETRAKMSASRKGKPVHTAESRARIAAAVSLRCKGKTLPHLRGRPMTEEHKAALRAGWARRRALTQMEIH